MRKLVLTLAALAAVAVTLPAVSNSANADPLVVIRRDHGPHYGYWRRHHDRDWSWRHHDRDWSWRHRHRDRDFHRHGPALIIR